MRPGKSYPFCIDTVGLHFTPELSISDQPLQIPLFIVPYVIVFSIISLNSYALAATFKVEN